MAVPMKSTGAPLQVALYGGIEEATRKTQKKPRMRRIQQKTVDGGIRTYPSPKSQTGGRCGRHRAEKGRILQWTRLHIPATHAAIPKHSLASAACGGGAGTVTGNH